MVDMEGVRRSKSLPFMALARFHGLLSATFHPSLQDQDGGHAVNRLPALFNGKLRLAEQTVGFGRGEPLVPKVDRQFEVPPEFLGKGVDLLCLSAFGPAHPKWKSDHDFFHIELPDHPVKVSEIISFVLPTQCFQALSGQP